MTKQPVTNDDLGSVSVLGLGRMGRALATALLDAGFRTTVWNRSSGADAGLIERGAIRVETPTEALLANPIAIVSLSDHAAIPALIQVDPDTSAGRTLVNLATCTPEEARALATWAAGHKLHYLDGAMMAVPQTVATAEAFFLYSGSRAAFDLHRPILDTLAASHYLGEDPALAELWDLALLGTGYASLTGFLHSIAMLEPADVSPTRFVRLAAQWLHGMIAFMGELAAEVESGDYSEGVSPVDMNRAAVENLIHTSRRYGVDAEVHSPLRALLARRSASGHGSDSFSSLFELLRPQS